MTPSCSCRVVKVDMHLVCWLAYVLELMEIESVTISQHVSVC